MALIRFTYRFLFLILAVFLVLPIILLLIAVSQKIGNRKLNKKVVNKWSRLLCFVCGLKLSIKGEIHTNPVFLVANHVSWLDIPVIHSFKLVGFVAKSEISQWPILGRIVKSGETLFIARGQSESRKNVLNAIKNRLQKGRSIAVFPEGRVTNGTYLARFHRQLMHAAIETQTPLQAIAIKYIKADGMRNKDICFFENETFVSNVFRLLSLRSSEVELVFCKTIATNNLTAREVAQRSHQQVAGVLAENDYM